MGQITMGDFQEQFSEVCEHALRTLYASAPRHGLDSVMTELCGLMSITRQIKISANRRGDEEFANLFLCCECVLGAFHSEVLMYIALREERPHDAWMHYVDAEEYAAVALRIPSEAVVVDVFQKRYSAIESVLFPRMKYMSVGCNRTEGVCSICEKKISECFHVPGRIYSGQVCAEYNYRILESDHLALVEIPKSKRCYFRMYSCDGGATWIDWFTNDRTAAILNQPMVQSGSFLFVGQVFDARLPIGAKL